MSNLCLGYTRTVVEVAKYDLESKVFPRIFAQMEPPTTGMLKAFDSDSPYELYVCIWFDNSRKQTAGRIWFVDPKRLCFENGISACERVLLYVGGEGMLKHLVDEEMVRQLERVVSDRWTVQVKILAIN